jgi:hypothetical protein
MGVAPPMCYTRDKDFNTPLHADMYLHIHTGSHPPSSCSYYLFCLLEFSDFLARDLYVRNYSEKMRETFAGIANRLRGEVEGTQENILKNRKFDFRDVAKPGFFYH